jgi:hypothetical protein
LEIDGKVKTEEDVVGFVLRNGYPKADFAVAK